MVPVYFKGKRLEDESEERCKVGGTVHVMHMLILLLPKTEPTTTFQICETE